MTWRRRLAEMLELEPASGVPFTVEPDGSVLLHLTSKSIDLGRLPEGVVEQEIDERRDGDATVARRFRFPLFRLGGQLYEIPSKRVLRGTGLALLLVAFFLCHARQPIRRDSETEGAAA